MTLKASFAQDLDAAFNWGSLPIVWSIRFKSGIFLNRSLFSGNVAKFFTQPQAG